MTRRLQRIQDNYQELETLLSQVETRMDNDSYLAIELEQAVVDGDLTTTKPRKRPSHVKLSSIKRQPNCAALNS
ncbi:MAG: hypothetical protein R3C03_19590 [Pirellulaceae bacterium]